MKILKRTLALLLSLTLTVSLCACGDGQADSSASPDPGASPTIEVDLTQDITAFSAGLSPTDVLLTVNGEEIPAGLFLYILYDDCNWLMYQYYSTYWSLPDSLEPFAEMLLNDTADVVAYHIILRQKAAELGCVLTDEQRAEVDAARTGENLGSYEQYKAVYGLTDESMDFLATLDYYYENLLGTIPMPAEDDLDNYVYQTKHILLLTVDTSGTPGYNEDGEYGYPALDEETVAEKRVLAEDILARLRAAEGEEQLALFDELMEEYSEDGRDKDGHIDANGYEATLGSMVEGYERGSLALGFGEISDIVESSYGYHIILRQEVEFRDASAEEYAEAYRAYLLDQKIAEWVDSAEITRAETLLAGIDVTDFFDRYYAYYSTVKEQLEVAGE